MRKGTTQHTVIDVTLSKKDSRTLSMQLNKTIINFKENDRPSFN